MLFKDQRKEQQSNRSISEENPDAVYLHESALDCACILHFMLSLERRLARRDLQQHRTSFLCPLFMERCLCLAYVNEGWEDDGEKWRSRSRQRE